MSPNVRNAYLEAATQAVALLSTDRVADAWPADSVLNGMSVGSLASHLARSVLQVEWFLDGPTDGSAPLSPVTYYARIVDAERFDSPLNVGVRARSDETADEGAATVQANTAAALERVEKRLVTEPDDRHVAILHRPGEEMLLDDYLLTRCVELAVHTEDLALSIDSLVRAPAACVSLAVDLLMAAAHERHGDEDILRALARRERDKVDALRVL